MLPAHAGTIGLACPLLCTFIRVYILCKYMNYGFRIQNYDVWHMHTYFEIILIIMIAEFTSLNSFEGVS